MRNFKYDTASNKAAVNVPGMIISIMLRCDSCDFLLLKAPVVMLSYIGLYHIGVGLYCCSFSSIRQFSRPQSVDRTADGSRFFMPCVVWNNGRKT